jgi:uncharacterized membrane protein YbhN (UPF0104 family)
VTEPPRRSESAAQLPPEVSTRQATGRFMILFAIFAVLSIVGFAWLLRGTDDAAQLWQSIGRQPWWFYGLVAAASALLIFAEVVRVMVHGRAVAVAMPFRTAFDATIANNFMSWLSPGGLLGEPAATYVMAKYGTPIDGALLAAYVKFVISFAFIMALAFAGIALGFSPPFPLTLTISVLSGIGIFVALAALLVGGAMFPQQSGALVAKLEQRIHRSWIARGRLRGINNAIFTVAKESIIRLSALRQRGTRWLLPVLLSHVGYYVAYACIMLAIAHGLTPGQHLDSYAVVMRGFVYLSFLHILPTPGGTAIGEMAAHAFFASTFGRGLDVEYVLWFRAATLYLHVAFGLVYLPLIGVWRGVLGKRLWSGKTSTPSSSTNTAP